MDATLTFQDRETAKTFASFWAFATMTGHTISATGADGVTTVEVYDVTDAKKAIIEDFMDVIA